jgi:16S rRNA C967 or C1407 C5-methylase (RsmB/RsmF family)/NOL1/NOP2/fmu family ribosome biogenesis protein
VYNLLKMLQLPDSFVINSKEIFKDEYPEFIASLQKPSPTSIRFNNKLALSPSEEKVSWCDDAFYLPERPLFTADPLFHSGAYYVQEASSMFLYKAIKQHFANSKTVLDLCAAPGGKSTLLSQTLSQDSLLICNEVVRSRAYILAENIIKWGNPNVIVTNNQPSDFGEIPSFFDAIVVDAPCSGEGMFRKDSGAIHEWSVANVENCVVRQREILTQVWDSLKQDGILVYSTCTYNFKENEENVTWICEELGAEALTIDIDENKDITTSNYGYRFYPHKTKGEGFFLAVMRKTSHPNRNFKLKPNKKKNAKPLKDIKLPYFKLRDESQWLVVENSNQFNAFPVSRVQEYEFLQNQFKCLSAGLFLGEIKGRDFIPSINLALSKQLDHASTIMVEVDYHTAISYLKKEAINLNDMDKTYIIICYKGLPLGWVKNLGNRCNNMYPNEWRIRMNTNNF